MIACAWVARVCVGVTLQFITGLDKKRACWDGRGLRCEDDKDGMIVRWHCT